MSGLPRLSAVHSIMHTRSKPICRTAPAISASASPTKSAATHAHALTTADLLQHHLALLAGGFSNRTVQCTDSSSGPVADSHCLAAKPARSAACNSHPCSFCSENLCSGHGTCSQGRCHCPVGYGGIYCEVSNQAVLLAVSLNREQRCSVCDTVVSCWQNTPAAACPAELHASLVNNRAHDVCTKQLVTRA